MVAGGVATYVTAAPPINGQIFVVAVTPPAPVMDAGVPGIPLVILRVRVTVVPLQPIIDKLTVPVVNVEPYFIFTLLP